MATTLNDAFRAIVKEENKHLLKEIKVFFNAEIIKPPPKPMNFNQTLEYLSCSKSYLYKLTSNRKIPHAKQGKRLIFDKKSLDDWLLEDKVKTISEIQEETETILNSTNTKSKF